MKIRHVNNIIIELEEWEVRFLLNVLLRTPQTEDDDAIIERWINELERLTQREA